MGVAEPQTPPPQDGAMPLKTKSEIDEVRLEAALGHKPELKRNFGLWSLTSLGIVIAKYLSHCLLRTSGLFTLLTFFFFFSALGLLQEEQLSLLFRMVVPWP